MKDAKVTAEDIQKDQAKKKAVEDMFSDQSLQVYLKTNNTVYVNLINRYNTDYAGSEAISEICALNDAENTIISSSYGLSDVTRWSRRDLPRVIRSFSITYPATIMAVSPNKKLLAVVGGYKDPEYDSRSTYELRIFSLTNSYEKVIRTSGPINSLVFKDDRYLLYTMPNHTIKIYSVEKEETVDEIGPNNFNTVGDKKASWWFSTGWMNSYIPGDNFIDIQGDTLILANVRGISCYSLASHQKYNITFNIPKIENKTLYNPHDWRFKYVAFSGNRVIAGVGDEKLYVWYLDGEYQGELKGHTERVCSIKALKDCSLVISSSLDKTIRVWDPSTLTLLTTIELPAIANRFDAFVREGHIYVAAGLLDGKIHFQKIYTLNPKLQQTQASSAALGSAITTATSVTAASIAATAITANVASIASTASSATSATSMPVATATPIVAAANAATVATVVNTATSNSTILALTAGEAALADFKKVAKMLSLAEKAFNKKAILDKIALDKTANAVSAGTTSSGTASSSAAIINSAAASTTQDSVTINIAIDIPDAANTTAPAPAKALVFNSIANSSVESKAEEEKLRQLKSTAVKALNEYLTFLHGSCYKRSETSVLVLAGSEIMAQMSLDNTDAPAPAETSKTQK
jgi:WD40 repeat protein